MMRGKRPRLTQTNAHTGGGRLRSMSDDNMGGDDHLLHMDPSLMTERQQLAFLLRTTAQDPSGSDAHTSSGSDDDEVTAPRATKRSKPRIPRAKSSPRESHVLEEPTTGSRRGRPRKNPKHTTTDDATSAVKPSPRASTTSKPKTVEKRLHVTTSDSEEAELMLSTSVGKISIVKPSPSSASDVGHMSVFDADGEFWSLHCAVCSQAALPPDSVLDEPMFLCAACDEKYPTQRALGRV